MLGRLEMDVDTCIERYNSMCKRIFADKGIPVRLSAGGKRFSFGGKSIAIKGAFDHQILEQCIKEIIVENSEDPAVRQELSEDATNKHIFREAADALLDDGRDRSCKV